MRAAVTRAVGAMEVVDLAEPGPPGPGEVLVRSEAVGICGSDYHFLLGELSATAGGGASPFPKIQGHEVGGTIEALGPGCRPELDVAARVALYPLHACGHCYPCSVGRPNTCDNFTLIGIHLDGGLQQYLNVPQEQVFPIATDDGAVAATAEPVSVHGQPTAFLVGQAEPAAQVPTEDTVFFDQVGHGVLLLLIEPADERGQEHAESPRVEHGGRVYTTGRMSRRRRRSAEQ